MAESTTGISSVALQRLKTLPRLLKEQYGVSATQEEITSALVHGTTVAQLAGMLVEYNRYKAVADAEALAEAEAARSREKRDSETP